MGEKESNVDPKIIEEINKEGWEGNAAVIIGKEGKEMENLRQKLETEGNCADAASFVRMHKTEAVPYERVQQEIRNINDYKGRGFIGSRSFHYIDKGGNVAYVDIDYKKIASMPHSNNWETDRDAFISELEKQGFRIHTGDPSGEDHTFWINVLNLLHRHHEEIEKQSQERSKKEFDF